MFPVALAEAALEGLTNTGNLVFQSFSDSGTELIAAERTGRRGGAGPGLLQSRCAETGAVDRKDRSQHCRERSTAKDQGLIPDAQLHQSRRMCLVETTTNVVVGTRSFPGGPVTVTP